MASSDHQMMAPSYTLLQLRGATVRPQRKPLPFFPYANMVSLLDDSLESEIAMLLIILAATTATVEMQPQKAEPACLTDRVLVAFDAPTVVPFGGTDQAKRQAVLISKIIEQDKPTLEHDLFPNTSRPSKGPAILTPDCSSEKPKKKDYPFA